ncbi:hypothetical protein LT493_24840 [Streptomyces tricolor]|nr:hypothetical protein [Streptomyces tricolor]
MQAAQNPPQGGQSTDSEAKAAYVALVERIARSGARDAAEKEELGGLSAELTRWLAERRLLDPDGERLTPPERALHRIASEHRRRLRETVEGLSRDARAIEDVPVAAGGPAARRPGGRGDGVLHGPRAHPRAAGGAGRAQPRGVPGDAQLLPRGAGPGGQSRQGPGDGGERGPDARADLAAGPALARAGPLSARAHRRRRRGAGRRDGAAAHEHRGPRDRRPRGGAGAAGARAATSSCTARPSHAASCGSSPTPGTSPGRTPSSTPDAAAPAAN